MKNTILLSALILALGSLATPANGAEILWSQYCQHLGKPGMGYEYDEKFVASRKKLA